MVEAVEFLVHDWGVLHFSEGDVFFRGIEVPELSGHTVFRHYLGAGSCSFYVLVHQRWRILLSGIKARGRACRLSFYCKQSGEPGLPEGFINDVDRVMQELSRTPTKGRVDLPTRKPVDNTSNNSLFGAAVVERRSHGVALLNRNCKRRSGANTSILP